MEVVRQHKLNINLDKLGLIGVLESKFDEVLPRCVNVVCKMDVDVTVGVSWEQVKINGIEVSCPNRFFTDKNDAVASEALCQANYENSGRLLSDWLLETNASIDKTVAERDAALETASRAAAASENLC